MTDRFINKTDVEEFFAQETIPINEFIDKLSAHLDKNVIVDTKNKLTIDNLIHEATLASYSLSALSNTVNNFITQMTPIISILIAELNDKLKEYEEE